MNCRECELALAMEPPPAEVDQHLAGCPDCREFAEEVRANAAALSAMASDELPPVGTGVVSQIRAAAHRRQAIRWAAGLAAAAAAAIVLISWPREQPIPLPPVRFAVTAPKIEAPTAKIVPEAARHPRKAAPLMVKMLTEDPNVVIYWEVETKEGTEP